ncbi:choice-of-anchor I family protein [Paenibacillus sp. YN15]|uniref:choice-of-anchor I family protein n=1 Tax=Paenibacillus sp. YN15 TaxID=1742774 RepID=UPI000DCEFDAA|nr:choice-of-anchor I family protein [Paenibacillus sp. YN15]RAU96538.1 hypothetical protein DQG13_20325 [Paenibacillus sp. YN15]
MQMWRKRAVSVVMSFVLGIGAAIPALVAESFAVPAAAQAALGPDIADASNDELTMTLIGRYNAGKETAAEIVSYNKSTHKAYVINGADKSLDILDLSTLQSSVTGGTYQDLSLATRITLQDLGLADSDEGSYDMTSVAVSPLGDYLALAIPYVKKDAVGNALEHYKGKIVLLKENGDLVEQFEAGYLPDMVTFTPDGMKILAANEGEPNLDYSKDPEGSITVVDLSAGVNNATVTQVSLVLDDSVFDANVRLFPQGKSIEALASANGTSVAIERAKDLEPEYIAVASDSNYAYVTLQENNAIATLNLQTLSVEKVSGLGVKDHSRPGNALDASNKDNAVNIAQWPVLGMYMPDGMSLFEQAGKTYLVTANEGDARVYPAIETSELGEGEAYSEEESIEDIADLVQLNRAYYPGYTDEEWATLQQNLPDILTNKKKLGKLTVTNSVYTVTGAAYYEALYSYGARSFSIWDTSDIAAGPVFDSGADFEQIIAARLPNYFNASNTKTDIDDRSDNKGPEPEDAKVGVINGKTYAFVGLERIGGIMAYNVTDPAQATFAGYVNSRDFNVPVGGDSGPEGLHFVAAEYSPTGKPLLLVGNEISGTVAVYEITSNTSDADVFPLTIIHTNDTHANIDSAGSPDNVARRITAIKQARAQAANSILVDAGDVFSGTLYFNKYLGQADLAFMNMAQYDAMTFGNHEFDRGSAALADFIRNASFPFVSANVDFSANDDLKGFTVNDIGHPAAAGKIYPALIKEVGGQKIGIFGLTTETTSVTSSPGPTISFADATAKAGETVAALKEQGINKIIALSHLGYDVDQQLAKDVADIDVIVGGHTHTLLKQPYVDTSFANPTIIVQVDDKASNLGNLKVEFDSEGKLISWTEDLIAINAQDSGKNYVLAADPEAQQLLDTAYKPAVVAEKNIVVGKSEVNLYGAAAADGNPRTVRTMETAIANLVVDGMLDEAVSAGTGAVMALQNGGGIRTNILAGDITRGGIIEILPYSNDLVVLELTGQEIWDGLENGVSAAPGEYGGFPHVAGMKFTYDSSKPSKQRVVSVSVKTATGYEPLKLDQSYKLVTNIFTAKGGDSYSSFAQAFNEGRVDYMYSPSYPYKADFEVFIQYLNKLGGTLTAANTGVEGRITDVKGADPGTPDAFPLTVLHTNDTHANIDSSSSSDNVLRRVTAIKQTKANSVNPLLLDAGDVFAGTLYFNEYEGQADLAFMNLVQYDAMTFGNHEFDKGSEALSNFIKNAQFPFVSANVDFSADDLLKGYFQAGIGSPAESGKVYPAIIKDVDGQKVGIFGLTTVDTATISSPGAVTFQDPVEKARNTVALLQQQGINKIIALSHLGYDVDQNLAKEVEGIDIIVGGHSHTKLEAAAVDNTHSEPKLIVQTGERAQNLGKLQVEFDKDGKLVEWQNTLIAIDQKNGSDYVFAADPEAADILAQYKPKIDEMNKLVVGHSDVNLYGAVAVDGYPRVVRTKETAIGNLVVDGMLYEAKQAGIQADMALQNGGGIRTNLLAGDITQGAVQEILPFNNDVVVLELTGQEIWDGLENGVSAAPKEYGGFPHVAGMKFTYDSSKPAHQRVTSASVKTDNGYVPLDVKKTYSLVTNIFTAKGGDAYASFGKAFNEGRVNFMYSEQYPFKPDYEVFIQYLKVLGTLTASNTGTEGRIADVKSSDTSDSGDSGDDGNNSGTPATGNTTPPSSTTPDPGVQVEAGAVSGGVELKPDAKDLKLETAADGSSVTSLTLAADSLSKALEAAGTGKTIITLPEVEGAVKVALPVSGMTGRTQGTVQIRTADKSYDLPLAVVKPNELAAALGTAVNDIRIKVVIGEVAGAAKAAVEAAAAKNGAALLADAVSYTITAQAGGKNVEINHFGATYVSRTLTIPGTVDPSSATAVVFDPASGSMSFVPAVFGSADGKTVITIKRNSNSIYGVVKPSAASFADLSGHWSRPDVELLAAKLVIDGQAPGRFAPDAQVTRGEFAALLVRALGLAPDASAVSGVKDLTGSEWYAGALGAAVKAGLLDGFEDGTLRGEANITRAQMAVMMSRALKAAGKPAPSGSGAAFADQGEIPAWAADAVASGAAAGLVEGTSGNRFAPASQATRGEAAAMLKRLLKYAQFIN